MAYNYVASSQKATCVTHAALCEFAVTGEQTLVVAKLTRLEAHQVTPDGLNPLFDVPVFGRIATVTPVSLPVRAGERVAPHLVCMPITTVCSGQGFAAHPGRHGEA